MAHKAIPLETRSCKGCGVEFQTTDSRKWFHRKGCGRRKFEKQNNAWLLANRPDLPTDPCFACGTPVVQYRKRRYQGELRHCSRACMPHPTHNYHGPTKEELISSRAWLGLCRWCKKTMPSGLDSCASCTDKRRLIMTKLRTRLRWLLPKVCFGCGFSFNRYDQGSRCNDCKRTRAINQRQLRRLRKKGDGAYESGIDYKKLYAAGDGRCAICGHPCDNPSVWLSWDRLTWMPNAPTVDHIIALANGGTHTWDNVQLACNECNSHKGDRPYPRGINGLAAERGTVPSDEFVNLLYGVEPA